MKNKTNAWGGAVTLFLAALILMISTAGCDSLFNSNSAVDEKKVEISKIDGQPIKTFSGREFYKTDWFEQKTVHLAGSYGHAIIRALNRKIVSANSKVKTSVPVSPSIAVKNLGQYIQGDHIGSLGSFKQIGSTHIQKIQVDGEVDNFILTIRPYIHNPSQLTAAANMAYNTETTYLALSPDRFYLQDNAQGQEMWPVTFPAVNMEDSTDIISVTFNKTGFVSSSISSGGNAKGSKRPNLVFVEATPVVGSYRIPPPPCEPGSPECDEPPPPPPPEPQYCQEVHGRGGPTGNNISGEQAYFMLSAVRLWSPGDGDHEEEIQMFVKQDDNYGGECFPWSYMYRFDDKCNFGGTCNTWTGSADGTNYQVSDINVEGVTYEIGGHGMPPANDAGLPLFDFSTEPGPWRLVLSDDDNDYQNYSQRRNSDPYVTMVWTFDMADGNWEHVKTGISSDSHHWGSSDDLIRESGVRRITFGNVSDLMGGFNLQYSDLYTKYVTAQKSYPGGSFYYKFGMEIY